MKLEFRREDETKQTQSTPVALPASNPQSSGVVQIRSGLRAGQSTVALLD